MINNNDDDNNNSINSNNNNSNIDSNKFTYFLKRSFRA